MRFIKRQPPDPKRPDPYAKALHLEDKRNDYGIYCEQKGSFKMLLERTNQKSKVTCKKCLQKLGKNK